RAATKMDWPIQWRGFATTTGTTRAMLLTPTRSSYSLRSSTPGAAPKANTVSPHSPSSPARFLTNGYPGIALTFDRQSHGGHDVGGCVDGSLTQCLCPASVNGATSG